MKNYLLTIVLATSLGYVAGYLGGLSSLPATDNPAQNDLSSEDDTTHKTSDQIPVNLLQFELLKYQVERLQQQLDEINSADTGYEATAENSNQPDKPRTQTSFAPTRPVEPNQDDLLAAGVSADVADQLLRRISQQNYRRLELQNLIRRYPNQAAQYRNELRELNQNRISLRSELDEASYDKYLYHSGQNNRVEVSSVMAGSPAETAGFSAGDIILSYDNKKILNWTDIRQSTLAGDINSYTNVDVLRNGERITLTVPRGTLGVQLNPLQLDPASN
jgi:C-terminal processing protease CtpA/Prc